MLLQLLVVISVPVSCISAVDSDLHGGRFRRAAPKTELTKELFYERCQDTLDYLPADTSPITERCDDIWTTFVEIIKCEDGCKRKANQMYEPLITLLPPALPDNKATFWSGPGVSYRASKIANMMDAFTLEQTRIGYIFNGVKWCCSEMGNITEECVSCKEENDLYFWTDVTIAFAERAKGQLFTILDGSTSDQPFYPTSYYALYEVPHLTKSQVSRMTVHLTYNGDNKDVKATCASPNMNETLKDALSPVLMECIANKYSDVTCDDRMGRDTENGLNQCLLPSIFFIDNGSLKFNCSFIMVVISFLVNLKHLADLNL